MATDVKQRGAVHPVPCLNSEVRAAGRAEASILLLFAATGFTAAALLFVVQPMIARMLLPRFGGSPAVWTTCMLFFQTALLGGYLYAHLGTQLKTRWQVALHASLLLAAAALPISFGQTWATPGGVQVVPRLLWSLTATVGLPFFVVSASAPLVQRWYAGVAGPRGRDPYWLYAASNAGSLLGLLAYPILIEPWLDLRQQAAMWTAMFGVLLALFAVCGWLVCRQGGALATADGEALPSKRTAKENRPTVTWPLRLAWVALAAVPSSLMLGVTTALSTDVPPVPMLWVAPLGLYLLTFILAFSRAAGQLRWSVWALPAAVIAEAVAMNALVGTSPSLLGLIVLHLSVFAAVALGCHVELAALRPAVSRMTEFYLCLSLGGGLGGLANAVLAPLIFQSTAEFPLGLAAAAIVIPAARLLSNRSHGKPLMYAGIAAAAAVLFIAFTIEHSSKALYQERSFFGVSRVIQGVNENTHQLLHGSVEHGAQVLTAHPAPQMAPLLYYHPAGPIGQVFQARMKAGEASAVGVVGLGCGSLAYYWVKDQPLVFFEIDPVVIRIAQDPSLFTFLRDSQARCEVVEGDARISLADQPDGRFGLLVIDAFSGDSIPVHLLTIEALELYRQKLAPGGAIAFHVSNNYFEFEPVLAANAARLGMVGRAWRDRGADLTERDRRRGRLPSHWLLLSSTSEGLKWIAGDPRWKPLATSPQQTIWTDDYANVLGALRMFHPSK